MSAVYVMVFARKTHSAAKAVVKEIPFIKHSASPGLNYKGLYPFFAKTNFASSN